ncbi:MAG: DUF2341 domain-containing protein, partial [Bacteroidota bacterium]
MKQTYNTCQNHRGTLSFSILFFICLLLAIPNNTLFGQAGPAGVGNPDGSDGQPRLNLWLEASQGQFNGTSVIQLNDLSGNNFNAFQNTSTYRPQQVGNAINGLPVVRFNGANLLETPGMSYNPGGFSWISLSRSEHTGTQKGTLLQSLSWLGGWEYRKRISLQGESGAGNNYQVKLSIGQGNGSGEVDFHLDGLAVSFPDDIRFTSEDGETLQSFWIEELTGTAPNQTATVWVKVEDNLDTDQDIFIYYGNATAIPASDPFATMLFYDDFNRPDVADITTEDAYFQTNAGSWSIVGGRLRNIGGSGDPNKLVIAQTGIVNHPVVMKTRMMIENFGSNDASRVGLSMCMEANGQGYNAMFRNHNGRFRFLNDLRSWGSNTLSNPNWNTGTWYFLEFYITNPADRNGWARFWNVTQSATAFENLNFGNGNARTWGYLGIAGSRNSDVTWFEEIIVRKFVPNEPGFLSAGTAEEMGSVTASKFIHQYSGINFFTSHNTGGVSRQFSGTGSAGYHINTAVSASTAGNMYHNGQQSGSAIWDPVDIESQAQYFVGKNGYDGLEGFNGDIAEMILFHDDVNDAQRIIVENYLSAKYGISLLENQIYSHASYRHDVIGIGITSGEEKHIASTGNGGALYLAAPGNVLDDKTNTFLLAAHDGAGHGMTTDNVDTLSGATQRWNRSWYFDFTGAVPVDVLIGFHFAEAMQTLEPDQVYILLYRADDTEDFDAVPGGLITGTEDMVWFQLPAANLQDGYYTIAPIQNQVWYAYSDGIYDNAGYWDQPGSWTLSPNGDYYNPQEQTPSTSLTAHLDLVVIPQGKRVVIRQNGYTNPVLDVREGILDFGTTTGHYFTSITGRGTIRLQADNFPGGNADDFSGAAGGTVEYYGSNDILLTIPRTFNHLLVNMTNASDEVVMAADYTLNGDLTIQQGTLKLNDDEHPDPVVDIRRTLIVGKNWTIQTNGNFRVGKGNTNNAALDLGNGGGPYVLAGLAGLQSGSRVPSDHNYHFIWHQIEVWGNFTNRGSAVFTNQPHPVYDQLNGYLGTTTDHTGSAVVWFKGATDNLMDLYGTTDFYHLVIDKGTNRDRILTVQSENEAYFRLFGSNILRGAGGGPNPELRKALWIKTGTLRLKENIHIPTLTEGRDGTNTPNADFYIPSNAGLWVDGATVYGTADNQAQTNIGGVAGNLGSNSNGDFQGNIQSTSFYGNFRITSGLYSTRRSGGLIVWAQGDPFVLIEGGTLDAAQFRSAGGNNNNNRITLHVKNGIINLRGNINGTAMEGGKGTFSMMGTGNVFIMEGGTIRVWDGIGSGGVFELNLLSANVNVTGGSVKIVMDKNQGSGSRNNYFVHTTAPLYNFDLLTSGTAAVTLEPVRLYRELTVLNDLTIGDDVRFFAGRNNTDGPFYDLSIGGDLLLGQSTTSQAQYFPSSSDLTAGNTTRLTGPGNARIIIASPTQVLNFHHLEIDKLNGDTVTLISSGRPAAIIDNHANQQGILRISGGLAVLNGILDYNRFMIRLDEDVQIKNFGAIGRMNDPNGYLALEHNGLNIELSFDKEASFGRLMIGDNTSVSGGTTFKTGQLYMRNGILDIGSIGLIVENEIVDDNGAMVPLGTGKMILTAGNHSDRGIKQHIHNEAIFGFPLGIDTKTDEGYRYTPAWVTISALTTDQGIVQVNNVDGELPTLNGGTLGEEALQYYWRIRHQGFDDHDLPIVENRFEFHDLPETYLANPQHEQIKEGKVVNYQRKYSLGQLQWDDINRSLSLTFTYLDSESYSDLSPLETGEFTAAHINRFLGDIRVFYSYRRTNNDPPDDLKPWNRYQAWSTTSHEEFTNPDSEYPAAGDVVFMGYDSEGNWHRTETQDNLKLAELVFHSHESFPGPRLTVGKNHAVDLTIVRGKGEIEALVDRDNIPSILGDLGEYIAEPGSSFLYNAAYDDLVPGHIVLPDYPNVFPELKIEASGIKVSGNNAPYFGDFTFSFPADVVVNENMHIRGGAVYVTHSGTYGDIYVRKDLNLAGLRESALRFNSAGPSRTIRVDGNILLAPTGLPDEQVAFIDVMDGTTELYHDLFLGGDLRMEGSGTVRLNLSNGSNHVRVNLHLVGQNNGQFISTASSPPVFGRIIMNKGSDQQPMFRFNSGFTITGTTNGSEKAIELRNGTLVLNHDDINVNLTTGGAEFAIPSTSALVVSAGRVNATGNNTGIYLDGLLRVENHAEAHFYGTGSQNTYIRYSSGGTAALEVLDHAKLIVGSQIRGNTNGNQNTGILQYTQTGGEVITGRNTIPDNSRAAFEVFNPGSSFIMEGGALYIARNQANINRPALYLYPGESLMGADAVIYAGHPDFTPNNHSIRVNSSIPLSRLVIDGSATTLRCEVNPLIMENLLHIRPGNSLNMNQQKLILNGNLINEGSSPSFNESKTIFSGTDQTLIGESHFSKMEMNVMGRLTLNNNIIVADSLILLNGELWDEGNTLEVRGHLVNNALHVSGNVKNSGAIVLAGGALQELSGTGAYGRLVLQNNAGARLQSNHQLNGNLFINTGVLQLQHYRLSLGLNSIVEGAPFSASRMITTSGGLEALGVEKQLP